MPRAVTWCTLSPFAAWLALGLLGCLPSEPLPDGRVPPPPPSCGNSRCEPALGENDVTCLSDCPHCWAVLAVRSRDGAAQDGAAGKSDGVTVSLGENEAIDLTFGHQLELDQSSPSVELFGSVTGSAPPLTTECPATIGSEYLRGAVLVQTSPDGQTGLQTFGIWTQGGSSQFWLRCARQINSTRHLRLVALPGASLELDAAHALFRSEIVGAACAE